MVFTGFSQHQSIIGNGWASTSVNTVVFRKNSVVSYKDYQFAAYYDSTGAVVLAKRKLGTDNWEIKTTSKKGNIQDAHNSISIMVDGEGYLHISWDHHGNGLRYAKSKEPLSLDLTENIAMTGLHENKVTYPEFYKFNNGDLLFLYRDGASGKGNLVMNKYLVKEKRWLQLQNNLIDGEGKRNAYWQAFVDAKDAIHISWVWRESSDVSSNHDMNYAVSFDGGINWKKSTNENYTLPINIANAEIVCSIPQQSELMNQTSMYVNEKGAPFIATYFTSAKTHQPEYHLIYQKQNQWYVKQVSKRKGTFSLSGTGTKRIPISRPQVLVNGKKVFLICRDEERNNAVTIYTNTDHNLKKWKSIDVLKENLGAWEPSYDTELWKQTSHLHVFVQMNAQGDGEKIVNINMQPVKILEFLPKQLFTLQ